MQGLAPTAPGHVSRARLVGCPVSFTHELDSGCACNLRQAFFPVQTSIANY
ncbi:hypothetical protein IF2G_01769 [Cordyceps javanica]|nr:hypothetical protein IF2G_01769 [Cordyceps javanica]